LLTLWVDGAERLGQVDVHEGADRRARCAEGNCGAAEEDRRADRSQDQYAFDAYRVIDTVIMGNKPLWAALEERERSTTRRR
jgi:hypothetical protein